MSIHDIPTATATDAPPTAASARPDSPGVLVFPPLLLLATLFAGLLLRYFWSVHLFASALPARLAGSVGGGLVVFGIVLAAWGRITMARAGTNVSPTRPALALVTRGPFRFTRNPLYLGGTLVYLGLALILNSLWLLLLFLPMMLVLQAGVIRREERYLEAKFGSLYLSYKERVRRWI